MTPHAHLACVTLTLEPVSDADQYHLYQILEVKTTKLLELLWPKTTLEGGKGRLQHAKDKSQAMRLFIACKEV